MKRIKSVVYGATRNMYRNLVPCVNSVAVNGNVDIIYLLLEDDIFPYDVAAGVEVINVGKQTVFDPKGVNAAKRWTYMTMMRCVLAHLFPFNDRMLWLDCDTIVEHDISELWDIDMTGYCYAGVKQPSHSKNDFIYINTGVLLCNLPELYDKENEIVEALNTKDYDFPDQDVINERCQGSILALPGRYNVSNYTEPDTETYIKHFAAWREWFSGQEYKKYSALTGV